MQLSKKSILKFCIFGVFALFLLIPSVSAEQVDVGYTTSKTTVLFENNQAQAMTSLSNNTNVNQYLYNILVIQLNNQSISKDYLYQFEIYTPNAKLKNISNIYIVGGNNNSTVCQTIGLDTSDTAYPKIYFTCPSNVNSLTFGLNNDSPTTLTEPITTATNFQWNYTYLRYFTEDDDIDLGPIISNQQQNTQNIINNQNNLLGNKCPNLFNKSNSIVTGQTFDSNGNLFSAPDFIYQNYYLPVDSNTTYTIYSASNTSIGNFRVAEYNSSKTFITRNYNNPGGAMTFTTSSNTKFIRVSMYASSLNDATLVKGGTRGVYCEYGSFTSKLDDVSGAIGGVTDAITDDNIGTSTSDAANFITGFNTNTFGLTSIVTAPLNLIQSLTSSTCSPLELPLPYMNNKKLTLPCMTTIYSTYFGSLFTLYQTITYGVIAYWVIVRIFNQVKDFKNPEHDEIEVVDL